MDKNEEILLESARLIVRLAISLKIHKATMTVEHLESHPAYAAEVRRFQPMLSQMERWNHLSDSHRADARETSYKALQEIQAIANEILR